jgi:hypothetical protein
MKTLSLVISALALILCAYALVGIIERDTEDRIAYRQWVADSCIPAPGESAIAINDGKRLRCTLYSRVGYGLSSEIISAAVMDVPR